MNNLDEPSIEESWAAVDLFARSRNRVYHDVYNWCQSDSEPNEAILFISKKADRNSFPRIIKGIYLRLIPTTEEEAPPKS